MRRLSLLLLILATVLPGLGMRCDTPRVRILEPTGTVGSFSLQVVVEVPEAAPFDPARHVQLNGHAVVVQGGPTVWSATIHPGFPLRDDNRLEVFVEGKVGPIRRAFRDFAYLPPKARLTRITREDQLLSGPLAHGRIGDWLLENGEARFVIQDVGQRDLYSVGQFGGNLIDAELVARPGTDNFLEIQPMLNVETVINAQTVAVLNDGQDGTPAQLRVCGPDDLLDFVNPSSFITDLGIPPPASFDDLDLPVEGCTTYGLAPEVPWLRLDTEVFNLGAAPLSMAVGDWVNAAGQLEQWGKPFQLGEALVGPLQALAFIGYDEALGVDYGYTTVPVPGQPGAGTHFFTTSGVTLVLHNANPLASLLGVPAPFQVDAGSSRVFTRFVSVGDGSGGNAVAMESAVKGLATGTLEGCVRVGGVPEAGSRVSVVVRDAGGAVQTMVGQYVTAEGPCPNYGGELPAGSYELAAARRGALYPGGSPTPVFVPIHLAVGGTEVVDVDLPASARVEVAVADALSGGPLPARVTVVGHDPSPPQRSAGPALPGLSGPSVGLFEDTADVLPFGVVAFDYTDASGEAAFHVEPGQYRLYVSRGTEYSLWSEPLQVGAGETARFSATLARVLETPGFVSSDFHVHGIHSADSRVPHRRRVLQFAGEGLENPVMTDHHVHTDLRPTIAALGLAGFLTASIGEEITTFDYGHFNGYPFTVDPSRPSGGSTDWGMAGAARRRLPLARPLQRDTARDPRARGGERPGDARHDRAGEPHRQPLRGRCASTRRWRDPSRTGSTTRHGRRGGCPRWRPPGTCSPTSPRSSSGTATIAGTRRSFWSTASASG